MNIVKGVADLLRRSSGSQAGEGGSWTHAEKHPVPSTRIRFSETGGEAILSTLWQRYENTIDKVEKRKSLQIFLLHFVQTFKNWEPENDVKLSVELASSDDIILGCSSGHPSEVILILVQEIARLTSLVSELNCNAAKAYCDASEPSTSLTFSTDGLYVLNCLMIANRSLHNCKVFNYYGGVQKVTALLKAAVVQLKTLTSVIAVDEQLSSSSVEKISVLQKILGYVVSIVSSFMELYSSGNKNVQNVNFTRPTFLRDIQPEVSSKNLKVPVSEARIHWQQRAIVLVMEAGGVNWLVELLRVIRRLNLKEQRTDLTLHYFTLGALKSALFENPRAQNHFRSIGGLEVLLDGIGPPSNKFSDTRRTFVSGDDSKNYIFGILQLQVVSMEVLRESVFTNMNNLQFLCENGRIHKYANSVCWPAFMLQEFKQPRLGLGASDSQVVSPNSVNDNPDISPQQGVTSIDISDGSDLTEWSRYSIRLSRALCSFLLAPEDIKSHHVKTSVKSSMPISVGYWELSIRWIMKALLTIFPCIKACSNEKELPSHIRVLANTMQHCILCTFRKVLFYAPTLLEVFREEGIWDMIFSDKFFYFGPSLEEFDLKIEVQTEANSDALVASESCKDKPKPNDVDFLQMEAISFLEYAATLNSNTNNLPECSVLLDAFELSARSPELATIFLRSLQQILQLTAERSLGSLKSLNAITRVLKVACIQAQEIRKFKNYLLVEEDVAERSRMEKTQSINASKTSRSWIKCMRSSMELFNEYLSIAEHVRSLVLHNASCIDCLFDLIWEESLRKQVLEHIVGLLKLPPLLPDDRTAKLYLCSKYLEAFTRANEREEFFPELSIDLLVNMREIVSTDRTYYQKLFCDGECFLHIVSLLNGALDEDIGEQLVLNVLRTLTLLLSGSSNSKASFRALVGVGYQTFQSLLLDFCKWQPSEQLLNALLDMLVDGKFDSKANTVIKNDDVILLFFNVLQKSSTRLQHYGLEIFQKLLKDSMTNQTSCFRAGLLTFLLDWFAVEEHDKLISQIAQLIQVIGGHSISGKDIRKIFALLRSEAIGSKHTNSSLLLKSLQFMLKEKGPEAFFEFNGNQSGILINTPLQWPYVKGFSFSCWLRVEDFPEHGVLGLFCFLSDNGRGCSAMLGKEKLIFEAINQKRHCVSLSLKLHTKNWHFFCITHTIGRAFSGGSSVRCYVDGELVSSEKCRYAKVGDTLTRCTIGAEYVPTIEGSGQINYERAYPFIGQMGPLYMFGDTLTSEQIKGIYSLGPSYMYSFLGDEIPLASQNSLYDGILDSKDGLSSKIIFGLNAQASSGNCLFNVSSMIDNSLDKNLYVANILDGTELCSRRLLQEIIYCVGGVAVFFPLLTQYDGSESDNVQREYILIRTITRDKLAADIVDLIASVLDGNLSNQQQMLRLSGLSILGFLFQSVPPQQLNMKTLSALKHLFDVLRNSGISELLMKEAISRIYLNPHIWVYASYEVQRDLYMFLIQYFENEATLLPKLCGLPRFIDIIRQFYWDKADSRTAIGSKPLLHSITKQVIGERPSQEEVHKIRLLLLSLAEMTLRQRISPSDIKALIAFFERSQDMVFIEDVLHMIIRALSHKELLGSFLEQVNLLGGSHLFINLLQRELEPIRLLGLQFLGKLLVGAPSEKKGTKFFSLSVGRTKSISENLRKGGGMRLQPVFCALSERLSAFPLSDDLYATLFDVLLGGASPKQVLQKRNPSENPRNNKHGSTGFSSHFVVPQIIVCIFKYLASCHDTAARTKILGDLLDLLESDLSNTEALMENAWSSWLATSMKLIMFNNCEGKSKGQDGILRSNEIVLLRNLYCIVLSHYVYSVKGGWHQLEETVNFLLLNYEKGEMLHSDLLRHIFNDLVASLFEMSSDENIFVLQPCRDNSLYLLKLADELLIIKSGDKIPFPDIGSTLNTSSDLPCLENQKDISSTVLQILNLESNDMLPRIPWSDKAITEEDGVVEEEWWVLYDKLWILISEMSGKGQSKTLPKSTILTVPSFGQRARGLVESLNIPAAEMAAVVVSGGIGTALGAKPSKYVDKAMLLRGEKFPRIVFHLLILYLSKAALERASQCVQQFISLLPCLLSCDDDQSRNRLHFLIWSLHAVRSQHGMLDDGARFHVISHLILEIVNYGKSILATSILGREDTFEVTNNTKETGFILSLIQQDRVLAAAVDEAKYIKATKNDRQKQLQELRVKLDEFSLAEHNQWKAFEEDITSTMNMILSSDDSRKTAFRLAYDEDQQIVADKWIHMFRTLIDERGPWSANPFPNNNVTHWKLDKTEDNWRRRPKLKRNYKFDKKLCYPPNKSSNEPNQQAGECIISEGSNFPEQMKHFLLKGVRGITEEREMEPPDDDMDLIEEKDPGLSSSSENQVSDYVKDGASDIDISNDRKDLSSVSAETDLDEVHLSIFCVLISPKRKLAGHLFIMQTVLHFAGQFLVEGTGGSSVLNKFSDADISDPTKSDQMSGANKQKLSKGIMSIDTNTGKGNAFDILAPDNLLQNKPSKIKMHRRWSISKIKAVHWTRYLLQYTAIEIFFSNSVTPIFLNFATPKDAKLVGSLVVSLRNESLFPKASYRDRSGIISFVDRRVALEMAETFREGWRRREINNFEYLMILNTLAGRSYNDLTQYPIFPWTLADYSSEQLDFNKSSTFRDLSKPVGALDSKRFEVFEERFRNFSDPDIPSFYYGSHYSSMGIVLFYLLRMEPFTALHRNLQGGKFDHADRLFQSIEGTYRNCLSNTSDVKELIPEFFYMPEFLVNCNSYHFGVKQDGEAIGDAVLPPWAKGSPEEFIYRNREALESEYVSSNLHQWIDLIFGYKQRGKPAVEAANVFYYLTYEGAVDLESMEDELQRSAIEDQIANFGQTPIQIFRKKHPRRGPPIPIARPLYFAPSSITLTSIIANAINSPYAIIFLGVLESNIVVVNHRLALSVKLWLTTQLQSGGNYTFSGSQEPFFGIGSDVLPPRKIGTSLANDMEYGGHCLATMHSANEHYLILCGNWENSFQVICLHDGKIVQSIHQHKDLVTCIAVTSDGSILATGSYDTTVMIWHAYRGRSMEKKSRSMMSDFHRKDHVIIETPFHILCGHDDIITCLFISLELDIVISGSKDGTCVFHTLREGRYVRSIRHPLGCSITKLVASQHGRMVIYADNDLSLHMYSVNGNHIASAESNGRLNCIELSGCGDFLVCAGDHGQIVLRSMHSLDVLQRFEGNGKVITSLSVTPEECILAGTKDGSLLVYSIDNPQLRRGILPRNSKSKVSTMG